MPIFFQAQALKQPIKVEAFFQRWLALKQHHNKPTSTNQTDFRQVLQFTCAYDIQGYVGIFCSVSVRSSAAGSNVCQQGARKDQKEDVSS